MCKHLIMTETRAIGQRVIWAGMTLALMCVAYFYLLDRVLFSSAGFSTIFRFLLARGLEGGMDRIGDLRIGCCCGIGLHPYCESLEFLGAHPYG